MPETNSTTQKIENILAILSGTSSASEVFVNKFGENIDIDTADTAGALTQVIWPIKRTVQDYPFLDAPIALTIQSDSASDTSLSGVGAQTVFVYYHDLNGEAQVETISLLGVTEITLPTNSYGVFRIEVDESGSSNTNVGTITVENGGTIYAVILPGEGQTQIAVQRIPNGIVSATVKYARTTYARTGNNNLATLRLKVRKANGTKLTKLNVNLVSTGLVDFERYYQVGGIVLEAGDWVYWECTSVDTNDTPLAGYFDIIENM
jgi:hypothetical protein